MPDSDSIKELLHIHTRRLQELKKKEATYGLSADPSLLLEIENIEAEIQKLRRQLSDDCLDEMSHPNPATAGKSVLVVEDNPAWQDILREYLTELGCVVDIAVDFTEARSKLQNGQFSLVTIDAHLGPRTRANEGILLMDYIRQQLGPKLPIIVVSGEINKQDLVRAFQKFAVISVLLKEHFECREFQADVRKALQ